ncbi:MAG TPA: FmdB family zinc ribbon protein [Coriobacteriia bacterium]
MPAYDFKCETCGVVTEVSRPSRDDSPVACSACGAPTRRVFSPVGVHFKGSGFHATDYKRESAPTADTPSCDSAGSKPACSSCPAAE